MVNRHTPYTLILIRKCLSSMERSRLIILIPHLNSLPHVSLLASEFNSWYYLQNTSLPKILVNLFSY